MEGEVKHKINLRELNDTDCTSVVVGRQIARMIKRFPFMKTCSISCFAKNKNFTNFLVGDHIFIWKSDDGDVITSKDDDVDHDDLNKLLVYTFRSMCDAQNGVDLSDTPEDILAYAETKLQEMLHDDTVQKDFKVLADSTQVNPERTSNGADSQL